MAKVKPSLIEYSGAVGREIHYTRFGRTYSRQLPAEYNDRKSEAQLRQRTLFKVRQATSALFGSILQRGLTKEAHENSMTEANYFSRLNKDHFVYEDGTVRINYPTLLLARGPLPEVEITSYHADGLHVELAFRPCLDVPKARPDDVVYIYAVSPQVEICQLVASVGKCESRVQSNLDCFAEMQHRSQRQRQVSQAIFDLPDLGEETAVPVTFYLYAIVESASTACIPILSAAEKQIHKQHRNINRRVSRSVFVGMITIH